MENDLLCDFHGAPLQLTPAVYILWEVPMGIPTLDIPRFQALQNAEVPQER